MRIFRIFNNNIVATITDDRVEAIAQGSGIGFKKRPGDLIDESKIEKLFVFHNEERAKFDKLMEDTPIEYFQIAQEIADKASKELHIQLSNKVLISLTDHIGFSIERKKQGVTLPNLMLNEVRSLYPQEYEIGKWGIALIKKQQGIELALDEAGYIAIHIVNAALNVGSENTTNILCLCKGVMGIIEETCRINLKEESLEYSRLITHLKYLAQRIFTRQKVNFEESEHMYELLIHRNELLVPCISKITKYIEVKYSYVLSQEEQVYLMIHLLKVIR